ncbi:MAG TPA: Uma2 family endonuclease [Gemmataceae bacterium]|nr:Uma2 family endonuclease [Gemmataceae bacterium]
MAATTVKRPKLSNFAALLHQLGDVPLERIRMEAPPGAATEKDVLALREGPERRLCELVDGVLVEKTVGTPEALLATILGRLLGNFVEEEKLGLVLGADGTLRLFPGQVRIPDVSFISWERLPDDELPKEAIASVAPNLAVEVLSPGNTKAEMERKRRDYFLAGVELVWEVDPKTQTAKSYTSPEDVQRIGKTGSLDGGAVLPGFRLPLKQLFARTKRQR